MSPDVDECDAGSNDCHAQAMCSNTDGSFTCTCNDGYAGNGTECSGKRNYLKYDGIFWDHFPTLSIFTKVIDVNNSHI